MDTQSLWQGLSQPQNFPALEGDITADVAIVGGGITGVTAAALLSRAGRKVALIEADRIGNSATGGSTGNLYATVDEHLFRLKEKWNLDTVKAVVESRRAGIDLIGKLADDYRIDCGLAPRAWHLFASDSASADAQDAVEHECEVAREAGLDARLVGELPLPFGIAQAVVIDNQAQLNPLAYVGGLARALDSGNCRIFERSRATEIDDKQGIVHTANGRITADAIVLATHTPKGVYAVQTAMTAAREYGLAARLIGDAYPAGIFWSADEPKHSIRSFDANGERYLLVIGRKHLTGKESHTAACYQQLEAFARSHFAIDTVPYAWSAQHYRSADMLPYIGKSPAATNTYIATGYATDGLVYGTLAASLIADDIAGNSSPWLDTYKPSRFTPGKSAKRFTKQNIEVTKEYLRKMVNSAEYGQFEAIEPGAGKVVELGGEKLAAYRDERGELAVLSASCTHLHCDVHWNNAEKSWDCPCHGSRFSVSGEVLEGPALAPLARREVEAK